MRFDFIRHECHIHVSRGCTSTIAKSVHNWIGDWLNWVNYTIHYCIRALFESRCSFRANSRSFCHACKFLRCWKIFIFKNYFRWLWQFLASCHLMLIWLLIRFLHLQITFRRYCMISSSSFSFKLISILRLWILFKISRPSQSNSWHHILLFFA